MKKSLVPMFLSIGMCTSMANANAFAAQKEMTDREWIDIINSSFHKEFKNLKFESNEKGIYTFISGDYEIKVDTNKEVYELSVYSSSLNKALENAGVIKTPIMKTTYKVVEEKKQEEKQTEIEKQEADTAFHQSIADAAMAQIGAFQDCTMLVTNSLAAVGIHFHGAPEEYAALGEWTENPVPGYICIYYGHVAIYVGDGMAGHGGWNGYNTILYSVSCANGFIGYIHVNH